MLPYAAEAGGCIRKLACAAGSTSMQWLFAIQHEESPMEATPTLLRPNLDLDIDLDLDGGSTGTVEEKWLGGDETVPLLARVPSSVLDPDGCYERRRAQPLANEFPYVCRGLRGDSIEVWYGHAFQAEKTDSVVHVDSGRQG